MIERANQFNAHARRRRAAESRAAGRCSSARLESGTLDDYRYTAVRDYGLPMMRAIVEGMFAAQQLDAIVYPTASRRPALIAAPAAPATTAAALSAAGLAATDIANLTGLSGSDRAGRLHRRQPAGRDCRSSAARSASRSCSSLGYSFEQATNARRRPVHTPALPGEAVERP